MRPHRLVVFSLLVSSLALRPATVAGQAGPPPALVSTADARDVASLDAIIATLYAAISGPAGTPRNWDRFRSLFVPDARLIPTSLPADRVPRIRAMSPNDYATTIGPRLEATGFFEREIGRTTDAFGNITHVFSAYESKRTAADPLPFARGINSIQLFNDGKRWWIVTVYWDAEREGNLIPPKYIKGR
jgi:hypothetical protein